MCTVVTRFDSGSALRILAVRDEFVGRDFDEPAAWWPDQPTVIGGRDRVAGGTWCASDVASGVTALLVNRTERPDGTPSRGTLPLLAVAHGSEWPAFSEHRTMASFNLVLAGPTGVRVWIWDGATLQRRDLAPGTHMITSSGVDTDDAKTTTYAPRFATEDWAAVLASTEPHDTVGSLVVRAAVGDRVYATVFGQLITAVPGRLELVHSRTPWRADTWTAASYPAELP